MSLIYNHGTRVKVAKDIGVGDILVYPSNEVENEVFIRFTGPEHTLQWETRPFKVIGHAYAPVQTRDISPGRNFGIDKKKVTLYYTVEDKKTGIITVVPSCLIRELSPV